MSTYVWCEDTGSGFVFWKKIFDALHKGTIVESKKNNSELVKSVSKIDSGSDKYYILVDSAVDNPDVLRETQRLYAAIREKLNVSVVKIHSFEFVMLSFDLLIDWIFARQDSLKEKRRDLLEAKYMFVEIVNKGGDASELLAVKEKLDFCDSMNSEQISSKLLFEITRNTGFETTKGSLGECFIVDCCDWKSRMDDDICGLDENRISADRKMREIFEHSVLKESFARAGL